MGMYCVMISMIFIPLYIYEKATYGKGSHVTWEAGCIVWAI